LSLFCCANLNKTTASLFRTINHVRKKKQGIAQADHVNYWLKEQAVCIKTIAGEFGYQREIFYVDEKAKSRLN